VPISVSAAPGGDAVADHDGRQVRRQRACGGLGAHQQKTGRGEEGAKVQRLALQGGGTCLGRSGQRIEAQEAEAREAVAHLARYDG
jgi:hypothetical protein